MSTTNPKKPRVLLPNDYKAIEQQEAFARKAVQDALCVMGLGSTPDSGDAFLFLTETILGRCYKKKALTCHPDKGGDEQVFQELVTASNFLKSLLPQLKKQ